MPAWTVVCVDQVVLEHSASSLLHPAVRSLKCSPVPRREHLRPLLRWQEQQESRALGLAAAARVSACSAPAVWGLCGSLRADPILPSRPVHSPPRPVSGVVCESQSVWKGVSGGACVSTIIS